MRAGMLVVAAAGLLLGLAPSVRAQGDDQPPHAWVFGSWTGGAFPPGETSGPRCTGQPSVIFTRDVVLRATPFDVAYRQRLIETAAAGPDMIEFRFVPAPPQRGPFGPQTLPDIGFGCAGNPNLLRVQRVGPDEIRFPDCGDFPSPLKRCTGG